MKYLATLVVLPCFLGCLFVADAAAQQPELGAQQEQDKPKAPVNQPWALNVSAVQTFENNVRLSSQNTGGMGTRLQGGLGREWVFGRGDVMLTGNASQLFYRQAADLNLFTYNAGVNAAYTLSKRTSLRINDSVAFGYAQDSQVLIEKGLVLPKVLTHTNVLGSDVAYELSPRTRILWGIAAQGVTFGSSEFTGGSTLGTHLNVAHLLSRSQTVGVSAEYQRSVTKDTTATIQGLLGTWQRPIGRRLDVSVAAGVRPYKLPGQSTAFTPSGTVALSANLRRSDRFGLSYNRMIEQAFGSGLFHISHEVFVKYELNVSRRFGLNVNGNYGRGRYPEAPTLGLSGRVIGVEAHYDVGEKLALGAGYSAYMRTDKPNPTVSSYRTMVSLTYGTRFRARLKNPKTQPPVEFGEPR